MRLVLLSDTHTKHNQVVVPNGDILVHAGDFTYTGARHEYEEVIEWLKGLPHEHKAIVAGNHDFSSRVLENIAPNIHYLENSGIEISGIKFWGSPITPVFGRWAHMANRGADIKHYWDMIPTNTDVLITHGPPWGILDVAGFVDSVDHLGCEELHDAVFERVKPLIHVFGHIHGGYGERHKRAGIANDVADIDFYNASVVDEAYNVVNKPWVVEI